MLGRLVVEDGFGDLHIIKLWLVRKVFRDQLSDQFFIAVTYEDKDTRMSSMKYADYKERDEAFRKLKKEIKSRLETSSLSNEDLQSLHVAIDKVMENM